MLGKPEHWMGRMSPSVVQRGLTLSHTPDTAVHAA